MKRSGIHGGSDCNGGNNQKCTINADGSIAGVQSGRCLDANAARVILWSCHGRANQRLTRTWPRGRGARAPGDQAVTGFFRTAAPSRMSPTRKG